MKIYTKSGDKGKTSLLGGTRTQKSDERIEAYGSVDELNSFVGLLRDELPEQFRPELLSAIQHQLFVIGSYLAAEKQVSYLPEFDALQVKALEKAIDTIDEEIDPLQNFILPGGHKLVSYCHICRTICRRAERNTVKITSTVIKKEEIVVYLNRLSDYFFILSRWIARKVNAEEIVWNP